MKPAKFEVIVLGGGKAERNFASELGKQGVKTGLTERSAEMIDTSCINVACIPAKTFITSAQAAQAAWRAGGVGVRTGEIAADWQGFRRRAEGAVSAMRAMNHKNLTSTGSIDFILGNGRMDQKSIRSIKMKSSAAGPSMKEPRSQRGGPVTLSLKN